MAWLIYTAIASLDGYLEEGNGKFDWAEPDEEVQPLSNNLERPRGTTLYGRPMYEGMAAWDSMDARDQPPFNQHFAEV